MDRRDFIKQISAGVASVGTLSVIGCNQQSKSPEHSELKIGEMSYRSNSSTKDKVSLLGYGMMRLPMKEVNAETHEQQIDQDEVNRLVDYAIEHGVNYYDTSPVYCMGKSEEATGIALKKYDRSKFFIATKLSNFDPSLQSFEGATKLYHDSMEKLGVTYLDYYLLHAVGGSMVDFNRRFVDNGMMEFLMKERAEGRIRNLGFSFHGRKEVFDEMMLLHETYHWDFVQIQMNYFDWVQSELTSYMYGELEKRNISVVIMEPLLGGRLSKVPESVVQQMKKREPDRSAASWAFRFCGTYPMVMTALSGMTYMEHLEDNLLSFCPLKPITEEEKSFLSEMVDEMMRNPDIPCTGCQYCMPCPYGINIPGVFGYYNRHKGDKEYFVKGYDKEVEKERQADHCINCGTCLKMCPQHINIPEQMLKVNDFVEQLKQGISKEIKNN